MLLWNGVETVPHRTCRSDSRTSLMVEFIASTGGTASCGHLVSQDGRSVKNGHGDVVGESQGEMDGVLFYKRSFMSPRIRVLDLARAPGVVCVCFIQ